MTSETRVFRYQRNEKLKYVIYTENVALLENFSTYRLTDMKVVL